MKPFIYILAIVATVFSSCKRMDQSQEGNISELNKQFISAWNNKDADKITSFFADDVQFLQANAHYKGKTEVSDKWVRETLPTLKDLKLYVVSSSSDTKTAYEAGTFSVDVLPTGPNEPHAMGEGNFILLWKKADDGNWKLSYAQLEDLPVQVKNQGQGQYQGQYPQQGQYQQGQYQNQAQYSNGGQYE